MGRMQQTLERAQDTVRGARGAVGNGATRETAAGLVERLGAGIKKQSRRAAYATERTGDRIGGQLERKAAEIRPRRSAIKRVGGYASGHPKQTLALLGLMTVVVALMAMLLIGRRSEEEAEFDA
jgi:hypothetical protein